MQLLIELRTTARKKKDFEMADCIRDSLGQIGINLEDRKDGTGWRLQR
jgi:cysteinyl-tRNA synthetase